MHVRPITSDVEIAHCAKLMSDSDPWRTLERTKEECETRLRRETVRIDGAVSPRGIVGFLASIGPDGGPCRPVIEYLCVGEGKRNEGIGTRLITFFEDQLYPEEPNLYLCVSDINPDAQRLYQRLGYLPFGAQPNYNAVGQTEFYYYKSRGPKTQLRNPWLAQAGNPS